MKLHRLWRRSNRSLYRAACQNPGAGRPPGPTPLQLQMVAAKGVDDLLVDDLLIEELLASRPHADDYLVRELATGRMLRMRVFASELRLNAEAYRSLAKRSLAINDPRVIQPHRIFGYSGRLYVVREYVDGESLSELVDRLGPLSPDLAVQLAIDLLTQLRSLPTSDIAGLRPQQVVVTAGQQLRFVDLDETDLLIFVRKRRLSSTQAPVMAGADRAFIAPEVMSGLKCHGPGRLIYSTGRILSFLATGDWRSSSAEKLDTNQGWQSLSPLIAQLQAAEPTERVANFDEAIRMLQLAVQENIGIDLEPKSRLPATDLAIRPAISLISYPRLLLTSAATLLIVCILATGLTSSINSETHSASEHDPNTDPITVLSNEEFRVP